MHPSMARSFIPLVFSVVSVSLVIVLSSFSVNVAGQVLYASPPPPNVCPYPCLPPPTVTTNCPPPPSPPVVSPPPPTPSFPVYNPPQSSYYPPYLPFFPPPPPPDYVNYAPPPPDPILPYFPFYYKNPPPPDFSSTAVSSQPTTWITAIITLLSFSSFFSP